ncbi:hypothetical protein NA57DRAFT_43090 [Rhizodiscina lignyota]|uniref:Metallo-beta-lactamase domain-containing protein n=1 Tax=Rhizodiscina lignyota TaxID=1504668 RepID=A0A9P4ICC4_9PEZI|nr:hypothetical protein NA57DRAFT_43090 [Rhizodiscina lignyota]
MVDSGDLAICRACGTQFDVPLSSHPKACRICDDPRQYIPVATGQVWTSLNELKKNGHKNIIKQDPVDERVVSIWTEPKVGIGQRCVLLETPHGNVLWDLIAFLDDDTINFIKSKGGLKAIVISHPHYYTTHLEWGSVFDCPVYIAADDQEWTNRKDTSNVRKQVFHGPVGTTETIVPGVTAIKAGGHFPGSLLLHWDKKLFIADTLVTMPSGLYHIDRPPGTISFTFMWSIPNMIPLPPSEIMGIWKSIKPFEFDTTFGAFFGVEVRSSEVKKRILDSMKIQTRAEGHAQAEILEESYP